MLVHILEVGVEHDALGHQLTVKGGKLRGVKRHEEVGHDAASAIHGTVAAQGIIPQAVGKMNAVGTVQLAMLIALIQFKGVVFHVALHIRLLDAAAGRREIVGYGETHHRAILKLNGALHESLAERAAAYDLPAVLILNGSRYDFGSRSAEFIDQHHHLALEQMTVALSPGFLLRHGASLRIDDQVALVEKLVGHLYGSLEIAASILLKVEDEILHALPLQSLHRLHELIVGGKPETADADVAHLRPNHIIAVNGLHGNLVSHDLENKPLADAAAHHAQLHPCPLGAAEPPHDFLLAHLDACNQRVVDRDDTIAGHDADLLGRAFQDGLNDEQRILHEIELNADAVEGAVQGLRHFLGLLLGGIRGVGIELLEHSPDGILHELVLVDGVNIEVVHGHLRYLQLVDWTVGIEVQAHLGIQRQKGEEAKRQKEYGPFQPPAICFSHSRSYYYTINPCHSRGLLSSSGMSSSMTRLSMIKFCRSIVFLPM